MNYLPPTFFVGRLSYRALTPAGGDARPEIRNVHAFTPVNAHETRYYFASARNFADGDAEVTEQFRTRYRAVLDEDKLATELLEPMVDRPGRRRDVVAEADRNALRARRALQRMLDTEA
jgi:vanillate O-demethylase monooxygenase subunit